MKKAAEKLGISPSKVYEFVAARAIAFYKVGGKILFAESDLDAYLASCRVGAIMPAVAAPRARLKLKHIRLG